MATLLNVAVLIFKEVELLDFCGPMEVLSCANDVHGPTFNIYTVAATKRPVLCRSNVTVQPDYEVLNAPAPDVLIVPGGVGARQVMSRQPDVMEWIAHEALSAQIVASVCTGALILGKLGLLNDQAVTTHHTCIKELEAISPDALVLPDERFTDNGKIVTAGGISAGIDMSLHLVQRLLGPAARLKVMTEMEYGPEWFSKHS